MHTLLGADEDDAQAKRGYDARLEKKKSQRTLGRQRDPSVRDPGGPDAAEQSTDGVSRHPDVDPRGRNEVVEENPQGHRLHDEIREVVKEHDPASPLTDPS